MASSLVSNRSRTCCRMSDELVHPISGSTALGEACSKSSTHDLLLAVPDCIAVLAGMYMRAVVINGGLFRYPASFCLAYRNPPCGQEGPWKGTHPRRPQRCLAATHVAVPGQGPRAPHWIGKTRHARSRVSSSKPGQPAKRGVTTGVATHQPYAGHESTLSLFTIL